MMHCGLGTVIENPPPDVDDGSSLKSSMDSYFLVLGSASSPLAPGAHFYGAVCSELGQSRRLPDTC